MASAIDPGAVLSALGVRTADEIQPVTGGRDTALFRVQVGSKSFALRVFRPDQRVVSVNETLAMAVARDGGIPVQTVSAQGVWNDHPALLLSWCPGRPLLHELLEHPDRAASLGVAAGMTLADIHEIEVPIGHRDRSWLTWALPNDEPLRRRLQDIASIDRLLHMDYHPLNVLTDGKRITAVLDWANARAGDSRANLTRAISILRLDAGDVPPESDAVVIASERGMVSGYTTVACEQDNMPLFHAYAGRLMLHDLAERLREHPYQRERIETWVGDWLRESTGS